MGASSTETTVHAIADDHFPDRAALILGHDKDSKDDGLLQVREIMALPLHADLVTLSACDTAFGKLEGEEGVSSPGNGPQKCGIQSAPRAAPESRSGTGKRFRIPAVRLHIADSRRAAVPPQSGQLDREWGDDSDVRTCFRLYVRVSAHGLWGGAARKVRLGAYWLAALLPTAAANVLLLLSVLDSHAAAA